MRLIDGDQIKKSKFHGVGEIYPSDLDQHERGVYKRGWNDALEAIADKSCSPTIDAIKVVRCEHCIYREGSAYDYSDV